VMGSSNACSGTPSASGPTFLRRLTNAEYRQTLRDLVPMANDPTADFPPDLVQNGFDNNAESITVSPVHVEAYRAAAEQVAARASSGTAERSAFVGCALDAASATARATCVRSFVERFGRRAWRRPLSPEEVDAFVALSATSGSSDPYSGVSLVVQAALLSPNFLFRIEVGRPDPARRDRLTIPLT